MPVPRREFLQTAAAASTTLAAPAKQPNILFLFPDQLRYDFIEPSSSIPVRTPNIRRLAASGVRFTNAVTPAPLCAPARACLASGREYDQCRVLSNQVNYPLDQPTVYQLLRNAGYHVMGCGKFDLHKPELDWGLDGKRMIKEWGFSDGVDNEGKHDGTRAYQRAGNKPKGPFLAYLDKLGLAHAHVEDYERRKSKGDNWIARNGLALLDAAPKDKPWFLQVNFNGPHDPWDITASMEKRWRGVKFSPPNRCQQLTPDQHHLVRQNYAAMIENIDRLVGEFLAKVDLANTLVVFSSDHGEMLGDHDLWAKRHPHHGSVGVPLIASGPGVKRGVTIQEPATTLDATATFLDYAGVARPAHMDSQSLRPVLSGQKKAGRGHVLSGMDEWRLVMQGPYKYVRGWKNGAPLLFDRRSDPHENDNLSDKQPALAAQLAKLLPKV